MGDGRAGGVRSRPFSSCFSSRPASTTRSDVVTPSRDHARLRSVARSRRSISVERLASRYQFRRRCRRCDVGVAWTSNALNASFRSVRGAASPRPMRGRRCVTSRSRESPGTGWRDAASCAARSVVRRVEGGDSAGMRPDPVHLPEPSPIEDTRLARRTAAAVRCSQWSRQPRRPAPVLPATSPARRALLTIEPACVVAVRPRTLEISACSASSYVTADARRAAR